MYWVRHRLEYLRRWREAVKSVYEAVKSLGIKAEVYVIGSVAEGRHTVLSDVDVLVCVDEPRTPRELFELKLRILAEAMDNHGLPWDYPIDLHVHTAEQCREILQRFCRKYVRAEDIVPDCSQS